MTILNINIPLVAPRLEAERLDGNKPIDSVVQSHGKNYFTPLQCFLVVHVCLRPAD